MCGGDVDVLWRCLYVVEMLMCGGDVDVWWRC